MDLNIKNMTFKELKMLKEQITIAFNDSLNAEFVNKELDKKTSMQW